MLTMETAAVTHLPSGPSRRRALALTIAARRRLTPRRREVAAFG
jgi:hypothetical protein